MLDHLGAEVELPDLDRGPLTLDGGHGVVDFKADLFPDGHFAQEFAAWRGGGVE